MHILWYGMANRNVVGNNIKQILYIFFFHAKAVQISDKLSSHVTPYLYLLLIFLRYSRKINVILRIIKTLLSIGNGSYNFYHALRKSGWTWDLWNQLMLVWQNISSIKRMLLVFVIYQVVLLSHFFGEHKVHFSISFTIF